MNIGKLIIGTALVLAGHIAEATPPIQATLTLGNNTAGIASDPALGKVFITNYDSGTVSIVDENALTLLATVPVGSNPRRIIVDTATHLVYLVNDTAPGTVTVINGTTNAVIATITVGNNPRAIGSNFLIGEVYASNSKSNTVSVISTATNTVVATIPVGASPLNPTSNDILRKLYVPSATEGTVTAINEITHSVIKTIAVGKGPIFGALDGLHNKIYVNNSTDKTLSVINSVNDTVIATVPTGAGGSGSTANFAAVSAVYHRVYLPNAVDGTVTIVNSDTDVVTHTVAVGATPIDALIDSNGGNLYVVNKDSNSVSVLAASSEAVIDVIPVGSAPWRSLDGLGHVFVLNTNGNAVDSLTIIGEENTLADTTVATEFHEAAFDHYFHTGDEIETRLLVDGIFNDDWHRTFTFFRAWTTSASGRVPVCRFFSTAFGNKSSHFYTPYASECQDLQTVPALKNTWQLESTAVYYLVLPDSSGNCSVGTAPLYRVYNNGMGGAPNHRYTGDRAIRDLMLSMGWIGEGSGSDTIFACTPTLT